MSKWQSFVAEVHINTFIWAVQANHWIQFIGEHFHFVRWQSLLRAIGKYEEYRF